MTGRAKAESFLHGILCAGTILPTTLPWGNSGFQFSALNSGNREHIRLSRLRYATVGVVPKVFAR